MTERSMLISKCRKRALLAVTTMAAACTGTATNGSRLTGCYVRGHEVNVFSPVDQDSTFWVTGPTDVLQQLRAKHDSLTRRPYQAVVAEVIATRSTVSRDGFARDYDGLLEVQRIVEVRRAAPGECGVT